MPKTIYDDLAKRVGAAIDSVTNPLDPVESEIDDALASLAEEQRELTAQKERIQSMRSAARLRKRPGRKPGSRKPETAAA